MVAFLVGWRLNAASCMVFPVLNLLDYPKFIGAMVAQVFGWGAQPSLIALQIILGLGVAAVGVSVACGGEFGSRSVLWGFHAMFSTAFIATTTIGRVCYGPLKFSLAPRYVALVVLLVFAIYLWGRARSSRWSAAIASCVFMLFGASLIPGIRRDPYGSAAALRGQLDGWATCVRNGNTQVECFARSGFRPNPRRPDNPGQIAVVEFLRERRLNCFKQQP